MASNSPGPWEVELRKGDRGQPDYFAIVDANGRVIMDTLNSEVSFTEYESDGDGGVDKWDEQGRVNCELIIELWKIHQLLCKGQV